MGGGEYDGEPMPASRPAACETITLIDGAAEMPRRRPPAASDANELLHAPVGGSYVLVRPRQLGGAGAVHYVIATDEVAGAPPRLCMVSAGLHPVTGLPRHS